MCMVPTVCGSLDIVVGALTDQKSQIFPGCQVLMRLLLISHAILYLVASANGSNDINIHILILFFLLLKYHAIVGFYLLTRLITYHCFIVFRMLHNCCGCASVIVQHSSGF